MTDVLIKRELLERLACEVIPKTHQEMLDASEDFGAAIKELRAILAAPRQPEGEGLEVVGDAIRAFEKKGWHGSKGYHAGLLKAAELADGYTLQPAQTIAELRAECERLRGECARLESKYERDVWGLNNEGDPIGGDHPSGFANDLLRVTIERDTLRQQIAERDAEIMEQCRLNGIGAERELKLLTQRDKLAGLLREAINWDTSDELLERIDAALDEVKPCTESRGQTQMTHL